jgi:Zinc-finger associated domain (zf-AD).
MFSTESLENTERKTLAFNKQGRSLNVVFLIYPQISLHDGLPQHICYECLSRIELFHSYKQSCIESQHTLKHWDLFCEGGSVPQVSCLSSLHVYVDS